MSELKRCPCGGKPVGGGDARTFPTKYFIGCNKCDFRTRLYDNMSDAFGAWNRRNLNRKRGRG